MDLRKDVGEQRFQGCLVLKEFGILKDLGKTLDVLRSQLGHTSRALTILPLIFFSFCNIDVGSSWEGWDEQWPELRKMQDITKLKARGPQGFL